MGVKMATAVILALTAFSAYSGMQTAQEQAKAEVSQANLNNQAAVEQGDLENAERAKRTRALAGQQKVSFLNSGLTLDGTPQFALNQTFQTGIDDINLATRNTQRAAKATSARANSSASSIIGNARSQAISSLASVGVGAAGGPSGVASAFGGIGTQSPAPVEYAGGFPSFDIGSGMGGA